MPETPCHREERSLKLASFLKLPVNRVVMAREIGVTLSAWLTVRMEIAPDADFLLLGIQAAAGSHDPRVSRVGEKVFVVED